MKSKRKKGQNTPLAPKPGTSEAGKTMNPRELPGEKPPLHPARYKEVPIGKPVSEENYRKMKDAAEKRELPPNENAQEDCIP